MKIKDIQVDGFGVWTGLSVDSLGEGMTLFYGPNEAGKTTLMQFLRAMLYGFTPQRRERYLPPIHGGSPGGAVRVTGPGGGYEIRRHSQLTDTDVTGRLAVTGQDGLTQGQHRLSGLLGQIDEPIFTNVFAIGIRELQELSTLDDTAAADELYKLSSGLDRVSLVDVLRSLRSGRGQLIGRGGPDPDQAEAAANQLSGLMTKREKLRDEIQRLSGQTRRWSELATQRRTQSQEIETLRSRMVAWEREARCVEVATNVFDTWRQRESVEGEIERIEQEVQLPDDAPGQLVQIDAMIEDRKSKLDEIKSRRRSIREKVDQLPINKRLFDLQGRIEAATQQATWVEALEEQIERLDEQIEKARRQVEADADRLGIDEHDRARVSEGDTRSLPDLSRQTLAALSGPAKQVKEELFLLKQSRGESKNHKARVDKLSGQLQEVLQRAGASDLQQAIHRENDAIAKLRHRIQLSQHLDKLLRHYRDLERESVELTTDEALPMDRLMLLGLPFVVGGMLVLYGLFNVFEITTFVSRPSPTTGMLSIMFGAMALLVYYLSRERGQRSTSTDLEDCERQIESVRRQIREVESERQELDAGLAAGGEALEARLRESESLLADLEAALPVYHACEAAQESYKTSYRRATQAADGLKAARREWTATLDRLGLSTTLSPKSVRQLGDGYETLQASMRRLAEMRDEREQRRRERQSIAKRIETLYLEAIDAHEDSAADRHHDQESDWNDDPPSASREERRQQNDRRQRQPDRDGKNSEDEHRETLRPRGKTNPLEQLNQLHEDLARQQHWIKRRRDLKEQDLQLKKQQAAHSHAIQRGDQQRRSLWAKCGVATAEQFYQQVDAKSQLAQLGDQHDQLDQKIRSMVGSTVNYDDVAAEIDGAKESDLERRWDALTTRMSETENRIAALQTAQGELAQSMKQLGDDDRLMTARLELGCVQRQLDALARRWQTLAMASCLLEDVCGTFERERQPETLREASSFLNQLTDGKYARIWTPLGTNQLKIDDSEGNSLPLEVLSRGTGEAVFIALRLSLAAAYARRGVMLPLILDDVLVNFDGQRALHAAKTLQTFAQLGHQVMMFTCHQHIVDTFHSIGAEVRQLPPQGKPGRATVLTPPAAEPEPMPEQEPVVAPVVAAEPEPEPVKLPEPVQLVVQHQRATEQEDSIYQIRKVVRQHRQKRAPKLLVTRTVAAPPPEPTPAATAPALPTRPAPVENDLDWAWFEREPADGTVDDDEAFAEAIRNQWLAEEDRDPVVDWRDRSRVAQAPATDSTKPIEQATKQPGDDNGSSADAPLWWASSPASGRAAS